MALTAKSLRSIKSARSEMSTGSAPLNFDTFIERSCKQFNCPIPVAVGKVQQELPTKSTRQKVEIVEESEKEEINDDTLLVMTFYDYFNRLVEINMAKYRCQPIPQLIIKIMALVVPYNRQLTKFSMTQCWINMYTIYELSKILPLSNITDVYLDHSPVARANYDILLSVPSRLKNLSLSRCNINDVVCQRIAEKLHHLQPVESTLNVLNLSSNQITDEGAKHLGLALRSNRHLRYLNLANNRIGDDGASYILNILTEFLLTGKENFEKNQQYVLYLKKKQELTFKCLENFYKSTDGNGVTKQSAKKGAAVKSMKRDKIKESISSDDCPKSKAEMMAEELLGPFTNPFCRSTLTVKDKLVYSQGNFALCYLNIAYNNFSFTSVQKLLNVLQYQKQYKHSRLCGLLNVVIDGNNIPGECDELDAISSLLSMRVKLYAGNFDRMTAKRKSTIR